MTGPPDRYLPRLISWNVTLRCPLRCGHCYMDAGAQEAEGVLSTKEAYEVIDRISEFCNPVVVLSGGEPLMRDDIFAIARYGTGRGLRMAMGTSGIRIDDGTARALKESGIRRVAISIDSADPAVHDRFRGLPGAWERAVQGIRHCLNEHIGVQINTTVLSPQIQALNDIVSLGTSLGVNDYQVFFPVPTGRASDVPWFTPTVYEDLIRNLLTTYHATGVNIRPTCAPQFRRIACTLGIDDQSWSRGCIAGISYCRIYPNGDVTPCPYLPARCGNLRESTFREIWNESPVFRALRDPSRLTGRCGRCEYQDVCGGCRARSYRPGAGMTDLCGGITRPDDPAGNLCGEDPWCRYMPVRKSRVSVPALEPVDLAVLEALQDDIPLVSRPFDAIAARLDVSPDDLILRIRRLQEQGIIRGLSPVLEPQKIGLSVTTLVALKVPDEKVPDVARLINRYPEVSHNYRRDHAYSLWFTIAGRNEDRVREIIREIRKEAGLSVRDVLELPTVKRFKIDVRFSFSGIHAEEAVHGSD